MLVPSLPEAGKMASLPMGWMMYLVRMLESCYAYIAGRAALIIISHQFDNDSLLTSWRD